MNSRRFIIYIAAFIAMCAFWSCEDDFDFSQVTVGEGEAVVSATIDYEPSMSSPVGQSRSSGTAISEIKELAIVIYKSNHELYKIYNNSDLKLTHSINIEKPEDYQPGMNVAEDTTARVTFSLPEPLPFGRYYMYAVANLGKPVTEEMAETEETLKSQNMTWKWGDVSQNAQMFGYMTADDNRTSSGYEAPLLIVNKANTSLHSWIKRLASKVTVAFDGSGLHQNIWVYVHNVSIRQLPLNCKLGEPNKPGEGGVSDDGYGDTKSLHAEQFLIYNDSVVVDKDAYPDEKDYKKWLVVANGSGIKGSAKHTKTDPALYFYENMQGDYENDPNKRWYDKTQNPDSVGTNVTPGMDDYKDNVPYGTFVEVEAYYVSNNVGNISSGPIKYRFMLGQNTTYNYDAIRNRHYKLTLNFKGYANQPDWHIEYYEETPDMFIPEAYMPYLYNSYIDYPLRFRGNLLSLDMEIIENNWAPYDETSADEVPPATLGSDDFDNRVLQFNWNRTVFMNSASYTQACPNAGLDADDGTYTSNYLYGRHKSGFYHLDEDGKEITNKPYYVTPVWVGFLRLQQPKEYESEAVDLPMNIFANNGNWFYSNPRKYKNNAGAMVSNGYDVRGGMKKYYEGKGGTTINGESWVNNGTNLGKRTFAEEDLTPGPHGLGRNSYTVERSTYQGENSTTVKFKLWTQPKTMGFISGFSGNNPYETYPRKAVIRVKAKFSVRTGDHNEERTLVRDVPILQGRRLINPKGVWRTAADTKAFDFVLLERRKASDVTFTALRSIGEWSASVVTGSGVTLSPLGGSRASSTVAGGIEGDTDSEVRFKINFSGGYNCAVVEVKYHGNNCVHKVFCRQGYNQPLAIVDGGAKWSSYSVFSCDPNFEFGKQDGEVNAVLTVNPLALGTFFKKGNYRDGILVANNETYPIRTALNGGTLKLTNGVTSKAWLDIPGIARKEDLSGSTPAASTTTSTDIKYINPAGKEVTKTFNAATWHWAKFKGKNFEGNEKNYVVPSYKDYNDLMTKADVGVGVIYGDGATAPQTATKEAFGFFDTENKTQTSTQGMRGFFAYNVHNGNNIFFPVGTTGMGRRTMQGLRTEGGWESWAGVLRYSAVNTLLTQSYTYVNQFRPIPYNMPSAPGAIYWLNQESAGNPGWDMNFFDMNFNSYDYAMSNGPFGDAVPIKLVLDE